MCIRDSGIATPAGPDAPMVATFPFYTWHHSVVVPKGHALEKTRPLTLEAIAEWPILTYNESFAGRANIDETFEKAGLFPDIVMSAMDIEVIKTYVESGLGIGIIASTAFDRKRDANLRLLDGSHLFERSTVRIAVRRGSYMRNYVYRFIELCEPTLNEAMVRAAASAG